mgnify:CR=1 FL=1
MREIIPVRSVFDSIILKLLGISIIYPYYKFNINKLQVVKTCNLFHLG